MRLYVHIMVLSLALFCAGGLAWTTGQEPERGGEYFGQARPGLVAELFAPGTVSAGLDEFVIACMPDGRECYWTIRLAGLETIATSRLADGGWTTPEVAAFAGRYFDGWPAIAPDGKRLFFHSFRPIDAAKPEAQAKINIWYVDRVGEGWSEPRPVGPPVNGDTNAACPSVTRDGTLYYTRVRSDGREKICRSTLVNGRYSEPEELPAVINLAKDNFHTVVAPDESYLIVPAYGRPDSIGGGWNYYVSYRKADGGWSELVNLGAGVNSADNLGSPSVSANGKYLFLHKRTKVGPQADLTRHHSLSQLRQRELARPSGGDIYWVDARLAADLKPKDLK